MNNTEPDKISNVEEAITKDGFPLYKHGYELIATPIPPKKNEKYERRFTHRNVMT